MIGLVKKNNKPLKNKLLKTILKTTGILLLVFVLIAASTACASKDTDEAKNTGSDIQAKDGAGTEKEAKKAEDSGFPLVVKDAKGVEIEIKEKPKKIVSLTLTTDEMLLSLVDKSRIAALSYLSEDPGLSNVVEEAKEIPVKVKMELETLISLQPDLLIVADWTDENAVKQLRDANITVYTLATPNNIDGVKDAVMKVAQLVGEKDKGQDIVSWMDIKLKAVEDKVKTLKDEQKPKVLSCDSFLYTYGIGTTFDDIARHAGVINLAAEQGMEMWQEISKEKIVELNPDVLFLPSWSYEGFDAEEFTEDFKNDKSLAGVNAVKNNRIFNLPEAHMTTTSQNIVLGVEDVAKAVYPELFK